MSGIRFALSEEPVNHPNFNEVKTPGMRMQEPIVVADADEEQSQELCKLLQQHSYRTTASESLLKLEAEVEQGSCRVVILNLDTLPVDNRFFRSLKRKNPGACIIGLSDRSFHPELEEAMSKHINACLGKPVDEEELVFWVKSLLENMPGAS